MRAAAGVQRPDGQRDGGRLGVLKPHSGIIKDPDGRAVLLGCARHRKWAQIRVSDHGPGIGGDPERLFRRFARDDDGTARQGYGLDLALARDVANRYGGSVAVESSSPSGTTMLLSFPLA
ncbi:ATPase/histidine kinase/DNA gyrase B/HSP90 domain protein [Bifidobacterium bifidum NCIMB 41171]|uniref:sensor histidine kinase n=1 Tax=Bifidobacterium bifidum TaxID=1681 RepID=UPI0001EC39AC|nr:HAMP domain-containing sensor histidine kinase [Bifidobacterium bifidum]EFR51154.1 ATPase/histidine kinase/DNA gyrase B/HSP90 domain protein [Bifidobacterium bifidum NCIMB 41171]